MTARLVVGWDQPRSTPLDDLSVSSVAAVELAATVAGVVRDSQRWLRYRLRQRTDWWVALDVLPDEHTATRYGSLALATAEAERLLTEALSAGGTYLPYGAPPVPDE